MQKAGELSAVMVGDSAWDVEAGARADVKTIAVLTGGFSDAELRDAGAVDVFESLVQLREGWTRRRFGRHPSVSCSRARRPGR